MFEAASWTLACVVMGWFWIETYGYAVDKTSVKYVLLPCAWAVLLLGSGK